MTWKSPLVLSLCVGVMLMTAAAGMSADLPITRVVLFSSGVGYFERAGDVEGNTEITLAFRVDQINDMLKSMTLQDLGGGTIGAVTYAPQDPLEHTLKSFAVDVMNPNSLADLLDSLMGSRVSIVTADATVTGTVIKCEWQEKSVGDDVVKFQVLNLLTDRGIIQVPIWHMKSVSLVEEKLNADLQKALGAVAAARDLDKRTVTIGFHGTGSRPVRVGYLLETPVWKTSYRLLAGDDKLFIQGWGIVENTTDDDWSRVRLSLVSGQPISFIQNLYEPLYVHRPVIQPQIAAVNRPQMYAGAIEEADPELFAMPAPAGAPQEALDGAPLKARGPVGAAGPVGSGFGGGARMEMALEDAGVQAAAQGGKVGELFQYAMEQPVSIGRQQSAMIPIVNQAIEGQKVSIYNASVNSDHPLNGLKLKNSTPLHLMGGAITVFDGNVYAGDALIDDLPPGDERLISYAVDLGVRVDSESQSKEDQAATSLKIVRGVMTMNTRLISEQTYSIRNVTTDKRTVIIEHPLRRGWELTSSVKPAERTAELYRFEVEVAPQKTVDLVVAEQRTTGQTFALTSTDDDRIALFLHAPKLSPQMKTALEKIVQMRMAIADVESQIDDHEDRLEEIGEEQERIRQNMEQLERDSELYKTYVEKFAAQEQEFEKLREEIKALKADQAAKEKELEQYILGLNID